MAEQTLSKNVPFFDPDFGLNPLGEGLKTPRKFYGGLEGGDRGARSELWRPLGLKLGVTEPRKV